MKAKRQANRVTVQIIENLYSNILRKQTEKTSNNLTDLTIPFYHTAGLSSSNDNRMRN